MVGQTIGSYSILRQLGAGAMGEVYLAEHRHLKRKAALKLLAPGLVGRPDLLERFFLEARATSAIAHAGIVQIFDCEVDPTGRPYIVMEYLEGDTLAAALAKRGPLPPSSVARLARSVAEALEAAHAKGIVHRDLKPENVFVQAEPPDTVKLVDFGIAKLAGDFRNAQVHQTRTGAVMGTPLYMSPEQCRDSANIDHRTDVYSLGCVVFELLTGRPPFTHDALGELIVAHMTTPPPDPRTLNGAVPAALAELVNDLLKKNAAERPTMRQIVDRLTRFIGGLTTVPGADAQALAATAATGGAAPAPVAGGSPKVTTFGNAAAELVADGDVEVPARKSGRVAVGAAVAVLLLGGGVVASRVLRSDAASSPAGAPPVAVSAQPVGPARGAAPPAAPPAALPVAAAIAPPVPEEGKGGPGGRAKGKAGPAPAKKRMMAGARTAAAAPPVTVASNRAATPAPAVPAPAAASDLTGTWEGPWNDPGKQQRGRLMLQIGADGSASGWMTNAAAKQSYRMVGRVGGSGHLDLACQCPPDQVFWARGTIRAASDELKGQLALSGATGVFGQSQLSLRHTAAARPQH